VGIPEQIEELDVVALVRNLPERELRRLYGARLTEDLPKGGLRAGDTGTVVAVLGEGAAFMVEFLDEEGYTTALPTLRPEDLRSAPKFAD
jgi:hypothetical protein